MMPKVIGNDSLIARVNEVEGCMYRQSNELGRLNKAVKKYKDENAKLRELANAVKGFCEDFTCDDCAMRRDCADNGRLFCDTPNFHALDAMRKALRELGIEVD